MKITVTKYDFERAFVDAGRKDQFSYEALGLIFEYMQEYEANTGEDIELDIVSICCEICEDTVKSIADNYSIAYDENVYEDELREIVREYLEENPQLIGEPASGFVYAAF